MGRSEEIGKKLNLAVRQQIQAHEDLAAAKEKEVQAQTALDAAVHQCYLGNLPKEKEDEARRTLSEASLEIDRLQRILPMLTEPVNKLREELKAAEWGEALNRINEIEAEVAILVEQICDRYDQIGAIGQQLRECLERASGTYRLLGRPEPNPRGLVNIRRRERDQEKGAPLIIY